MHWKLSSYVYWLNSYPSPSDMLLTQIFYFTWKKSYDHARQHIKKQRHYFGDKGPSSQSYSHVWIWKLNLKESWVPKNWCFWTVVWRRLLRVPWTARRSNQSILKEISLEYSLEGLILKLKLQCFGHLIWKTDSVVKTLMLGKTEGGRRRDDRRLDGWMASLSWCVWSCSWSWWWMGKPDVLQSMGSRRIGQD